MHALHRAGSHNPSYMNVVNHFGDRPDHILNDVDNHFKRLSERSKQLFHIVYPPS